MFAVLTLFGSCANYNLLYQRQIKDQEREMDRQKREFERQERDFERKRVVLRLSTDGDEDLSDLIKSGKFYLYRCLFVPTL